MNPAETAVILRQFNEWRLGDEDLPQPDPKQITAAIYAAVEMIEQLEAAESEYLEEARLNGMGSEREAALMAKLDAAEKERDVLKAKVERMEKRLRLILEEPENTMSNSKAMREMLRQARLALEETK